MYYLEAAQQYNGCPIDFITDLGTENGLAAAIHTFFRIDPNSHSNQRIEGWWSFLRKDQTSWWMNFFKDLVDVGHPRPHTLPPYRVSLVLFCSAITREFK